MVTFFLSFFHSPPDTIKRVIARGQHETKAPPPQLVVRINIGMYDKDEGLLRKLLDWIRHWKWQVTSELLSGADRRANDQRPPWQMFSNMSRKERTLETEMTAPTTTLILLKSKGLASEKRKLCSPPLALILKNKELCCFHLSWTTFLFFFWFSLYIWHLWRTTMSTPHSEGWYT